MKKQILSQKNAVSESTLSKVLKDASSSLKSDTVIKSLDQFFDDCNASMMGGWT